MLLYQKISIFFFVLFYRNVTIATFLDDEHKENTGKRERKRLKLYHYSVVVSIISPFFILCCIYIYATRFKWCYFICVCLLVQAYIKQNHFDQNLILVIKREENVRLDLYCHNYKICFYYHKKVT